MFEIFFIFLPQTLIREIVVRYGRFKDAVDKFSNNTILVFEVRALLDENVRERKRLKERRTNRNETGDDSPSNTSFISQSFHDVRDRNEHVRVGDDQIFVCIVKYDLPQFLGEASDNIDVHSRSDCHFPPLVPEVDVVDLVLVHLSCSQSLLVFSMSKKEEKKEERRKFTICCLSLSISVTVPFITSITSN